MGKLLRVIIHIDGGARGNPGPAAAGVVIRDAADSEIIHQAGIYLGHATNNQAEYNGLLAGLRKALELGAAEAEVVSDSELMVMQMNGRYRVRNEGLKPLYEDAMAMTEKFKKFIIRHVRREANKDADRLVNQAINLKRDVDGEE